MRQRGAASVEHFSRVTNDGLDLGIGKGATEARHVAATLANDRLLVGGVGVGLLDRPREPRPGPPAARGTVAIAATGSEDVTAELQHRVGLAVGPEWHLGSFRCTAGHKERRGDPEGENSPAQRAGRHRPDDTDRMGMDPTRPHRRRPTDIVFVGAGILVAVLLVLWAFFG